MSPEEWYAARDPGPMLAFLGKKFSSRKLRLFAVACCRQVWDLIPEGARPPVEVAERYADGEATGEDLDRARSTIRAAARAVMERSKARERGRAELAEGDPEFLATVAAQEAAGKEVAAAMVAGMAAWAAGAARSTPGAIKEGQASLLRGIVNPCPPAVPPPLLTWNDGTVPRLAEAIYQGRDWGSLPVLADACEESGEAPAELVAHLRSPGPHYRGMWSLDLLTGRE